MSINGYLDSVLAGYPIYCITIVSLELHILLRYVHEPFLLLLSMRVKLCSSPAHYERSVLPYPLPKPAAKKSSMDH